IAENSKLKVGADYVDYGAMGRNAVPLHVRLSVDVPKEWEAHRSVRRIGDEFSRTREHHDFVEDVPERYTPPIRLRARGRLRAHL
ncbi:hypothetical protein ACC806_38055, partial [Rhizobium ruizarguesonis]